MGRAFKAGEAAGLARYVYLGWQPLPGVLPRCARGIPPLTCHPLPGVLPSFYGMPVAFPLSTGASSRRAWLKVRASEFRSQCEEGSLADCSGRACDATLLPSLVRGWCNPEVFVVCL